MTAYSITERGLAPSTPATSCVQPQLNHLLSTTARHVERLHADSEVRNSTALRHHHIRSLPMKLIHSIPALHSKSIIPARITASA
jgi:hypothetical protein